MQGSPNKSNTIAANIILLVKPDSFNPAFNNIFHQISDVEKYSREWNFEDNNFDPISGIQAFKITTI